MICISHLLPDEQMREIVEKNGVGIESIEFSISDNLDRLEECIRSYRKRLEEMKCRELTLHGPFLNIDPAAFDSEIRKVTLMRFDQAYQAGMELGAKKIVYHTCMNPYIHFLEGWPERVADFFREFLEGHRDMEIVMENVLDPYIEPFRKVYDILGGVYPNFHLCLDMGHAHCYSEESVLQWSEELAPYITHVHVHDNMGDRDAHKGLGTGNIPWEKVLRILPQTEKRSWTVECSTKEDVEISVKKILAL